MVNAERKPLSGEVEVDATLVGGVQKGGKRGHGVGKSVVVIAVEIKQPNRVRPGADAPCSRRFQRQFAAVRP